MGIYQAPSVLPGQVGVIGALKYMVTSDSLATITTAGYLNAIDLAVNPILASDVLGITYLFNQQSNSGSFGIFTVSISNGVITLTQWANPGDVLLPVVSGDFANFNGTTGQIKDAGYSPTDPTKTKVVMLNAAPTINHVAIFTNANGTIGDGGVLGTAAAKAASNNSLSTVASTAGSGFTIGHLVSAADTLGTIQDSGVVSANVYQSSIASPDNPSDLIWYDITATAAALATAGKVNVQVSSGAKQYKIRNVIVNYAASGLSGGGGDRLLSLSDGTTVYNNAGITAALLGTPINTLWGGTGNPVAGTVAQNTSTAAGANLFLQYAGGTTDYTTGQIVVSVLVQRVA